MLRLIFHANFTNNFLAHLNSFLFNFQDGDFIFIITDDELIDRFKFILIEQRNDRVCINEQRAMIKNGDRLVIEINPRGSFLKKISI